MEYLRESERRLMGERSKDIISSYSPRSWAKEVARIVGNTSIAGSIRG